MAIYVKKESAIADTIQTPGDVGNDLDQIEKDIAGPKGIAAHEEEIEDALSGVIDDPAKCLMDGSEIAEASYMAMYESEYNFNQIIECLDIHTLGAASVGRELVLEAIDIKGFIGTVKKAVINAFTRFTEIINNVVNKVKSVFADNKNFVTINRKNIEYGFDKVRTSATKIQGYKFDHDKIENYASKLNTFASNGEKIDALFDVTNADEQDFINKRNAANTAEEVDKAFDSVKEDLCKSLDIDGKDDTSSPADVVKKIQEICQGEKVDDINDYYGSADNLCKIIASDTTGKSISDNYKFVKHSIDERLKALDKQARDAESNNAKAFKFAANAIKFYQGVLQQASITLATIRTNEIMQARKFANACVSAAGKKYTESADVSSNDDSVFAGLNLI